MIIYNLYYNYRETKMMIRFRWTEIIDLLRRLQNPIRVEIETDRC